MKDIVKGNWKKYLPQKCEATKYNKRLLALGMAMHSLGDAYAHRAWTILNTPQGTRWVDLKDDKHYADYFKSRGENMHSLMCENYKKYGKMRMNAVKAGCKRLLQNFIDEKWNTYTVFMDTARPIADYRLEDLYACCERVNPSSVAGKYRQYIIDNTSPLFTGGGITRPCVPYN